MGLLAVGDSLHKARVRAQARFVHHEAQKGHMVSEKLALDWVQLEVGLSEPAEHLCQMLGVGLKILGECDGVIKEDEGKIAYQPI